MNKRALVELIKTHLEEELAEILRSADAGSTRQSNSDGAAASAAESPLPADAVEALRGRASEIQRQLLMFRFLPLPELGADDVVSPAALVELELAGAGRRAFYFMTPQSGGLVTSVDGQPVQVIGPQSPIGETITILKKASNES
jgi:hypothetical protein